MSQIRQIFPNISFLFSFFYFYWRFHLNRVRYWTNDGNFRFSIEMLTYDININSLSLVFFVVLEIKKMFAWGIFIFSFEIFCKR